MLQYSNYHCGQFYSYLRQCVSAFHIRSHRLQPPIHLTMIYTANRAILKLHVDGDKCGGDVVFCLHHVYITQAMLYQCHHRQRDERSLWMFKAFVEMQHVYGV